MEKRFLTNPFEDDIVSEPRSVKDAIDGLNDKPLQSILRQFEILKFRQLPGKEKLSHAQLVVSLHAGYGKSHLIGRLFHKLNRQATLIYLRPFEYASACWKSILLKMVQELDFPDNIESEAGNGKENTQLEAFVNGIFTHLAANSIERGIIPCRNMEYTVEWLCNGINKKNNRIWRNWILKNFQKDTVTNDFIGQLRKNGVKLSSASSVSWLRVFFTYSYSYKQELKEACLNWLKGESIDEDDARKIGIRKKDDIPNPEMSGRESNELCKYRLQDFCQLAGFFRPFVFCFDQTENYGKDKTLAKELGSVIQVLADETYNQITVITTNQIPWTKNIAPCWEDAYLNRLSSPLELEGINRTQAEELIEQRFRKCKIEDKKSYFIADRIWLDQLFKDVNELCIRDFIKECDKHWLKIMKESEKVNDISEYYKQYKEKIRTQPKRRLFDPNILYWLVYEAANGIPELTVEKYKSPKEYFTLLWKIKEEKIFFGFESGSAWQQWQMITREAKLHYDADPHTKIVLFRTPELPPIPGAKWKKIAPAIEEAKKIYLRIFNLTEDEIINLYAAYDLYADTAEGNINFESHKVLSFIREMLHPFWEQIQKPISNMTPLSEPLSEIPNELIAKILNIVQQDKFMSVDDLKKKLSEPVTDELINKACVHIPEIKIYDGPNNMKVLQWQSKQSA